MKKDSKIPARPPIPMQTPDPYSNRRNFQFNVQDSVWWVVGLIAIAILAALIIATGT